MIIPGSSLEERQWTRFTPLERIFRYAFYVMICSAIVVSLRTIEVIPEFLFDAPSQMVDMLDRMWPPDASYYPETIHDALVETIHIATVGTILAVVLAIPIGVMVAENVTPYKPLNWLARFLLVSSRSITLWFGHCYLLLCSAQVLWLDLWPLPFGRLGLLESFLVRRLRKQTTQRLRLYKLQARLSLVSCTWAIGLKYCLRSGQSFYSDGT